MRIKEITLRDPRLGSLNGLLSVLFRRATERVSRVIQRVCQPQTPHSRNLNSGPAEETAILPNYFFFVISRTFPPRRRRQHDGKVNAALPHVCLSDRLTFQDTSTRTRTFEAGNPGKANRPRKVIDTTLARACARGLANLTMRLYSTLRVRPHSFA